MRRTDWIARLDAVIDAARDRVLEYGRHDCCLFVADCVLAMTDEDPARELRGYEGEDEARAIIARYGSLEALVTSIFGEPVPAAFLTRGDVALVESDHGEILGICIGNRFAVPAERGLGFVARAHARLGWRI